MELIQGHHLDNLVPDTEAEVFLSVQGNLLGEMLVGGLELGGDVLQQLVVLPNGCVEQNIFRVTPNILLTHYLDAMRQWHRIGVDHRDRTIQHILHGYARQMQYRQSDGSYFPYRGSTGSTWLTAYILKVFTMAHPLVNTIDLQALCSSAAWLIRKKQGSEGHFFENTPIYTPAMQGGYLGSEQRTSLTAFVLIALKEAELMCAGHVHPAASPALPGKAPGQPDPGLQRCHQLLRPGLGKQLQGQ
ncbi:venom factor-like isoform X1 [Alligator sinensis]|uniref:Venom factor-like isoform X1 n=1 Tax=Alligator sinensis TaxID=38654 RepID=A0A3Q0GND2_ALLSI|nr:venom factor-like isoform X1 [Alligator sinensis]